MNILSTLFLLHFYDVKKIVNGHSQISLCKDTTLGLVDSQNENHKGFSVLSHNDATLIINEIVSKTKYRLMRKQYHVYALQQTKLFSETPQIGIFGIFVLLKCERDLELDTSDISFNSVSL